MYFRFIILFLTSFLLLEPTLLLSQTQPLKVTYDKNNKGVYTFYAENTEYMPFVIAFDFTQLNNLRASYALPRHINVFGKKNARILKLDPVSNTGRSTFRYTFKYYTGCLDTKPDDIEYLLPLPEGTKTTARLLSYVGRHVGSETPEDWYNLLFLTNGEVPIHASRKGRVVSIRDDQNFTSEHLLFTSERNYVIVVHDDCTFARYSTFKDGHIDVSIGDLVFPGDVLGLSAGDEYKFGNQVRLYVYYRNDDSILNPVENNDEFKNFFSFKPRFNTENNGSGYLEPNQEYISVHPQDIILSELSRRERKKWEKESRN